MTRISRTLSVTALTVFVCSGLLYAEEKRVPTPEEFKEQIRQYNESGKVSGLQRPPQTPKPVEQFNRALTLHTRKDASDRDLKEAAALYQAAADGGIPQASTNLALMYLEGKGVKKDVKKALALLNAASAKKETQADVALARLYLTGTDVKKDEKKGEALLNKAVKAGNQNAAKILAEYREWKKKNELAMKEYQELMKKVQLTQNKPGAPGAMPPLQLFPQSPPTLPYPYKAPELQFPVIPGYTYVAASQTAPRAVASQSPVISITPQANTSQQPLKVQ